MAAKLTRLTHKIAIQLHLVAESCTICSSRSRRPVRKLLDTSSHQPLYKSYSKVRLTNVKQDQRRPALRRWMCIRGASCSNLGSVTSNPQVFMDFLSYLSQMPGHVFSAFHFHFHLGATDWFLVDLRWTLGRWRRRLILGRFQGPMLAWLLLILIKNFRCFPEPLNGMSRQYTTTDFFQVLSYSPLVIIFPPHSKLYSIYSWSSVAK
jgi:hypothetical protein